MRAACRRRSDAINAALDTLKIAKRLRDAGFSEIQAESVTDAIRESVTAGDLATKADLAGEAAALRADLKAEVGALRAEVTAVRADVKAEVTGLRAEFRTEVAALRAEIADVKAEIIKWMFGAMLAQGALVVTLIKLLPGK